jgi:6-pyruvoyltetrahydropterin/6-carboxytetrahydropterin synthase
LYEISVTADFDAAHFLRNYEGPCARLHGHSWRVEAGVEGEELGPGELLVDFHRLRDLLEAVIAPFDHRCLNDVEPFRKISPTSENLARHIFEELEKALREKGVPAVLSWVAVSESPRTRVLYRRTGPGKA